LSPYQFSIAMENTQQDYYFTEKLIDCFVTDTVPIYWGAPSIDKIFDRRGMIQFGSIKELESIQSMLTPSLYEEMLPYVKKNREIAFKLHLTGHEKLCHRLAEDVLKHFENIPPQTIQPLYRSKLAAGLRMISHRYFT